MMKRILFLISLLLVTGCLLVRAQVYKFDFTSDKKVKEGYTKVTPETLFNDEQGYGYDLQPAWDGKSNQPFFFSVNVPDGNYKVTVTLGSKDSAGNTTVRAESRRLFIENLPTKKGEMITESFTVNKRNMKISERENLMVMRPVSLLWSLNVQIKCLPFFFAATPPWLIMITNLGPLGDKCFHGGSPIR